MRRRPELVMVGALALLAGCGGGAKIAPGRTDTAAPASASTPAAQAPGSTPAAQAPGSTPAAQTPATTPPTPALPQALVTDERQNLLLVVALPGGRIVRRVPLPADPEDVATRGNGGTVLVVSSQAGTVTALDRRSLRSIRTFGGFDQPHIVEIAPNRRYAYVTDDVRGTVTVIRLGDMKVTSTITVGAGAHHLTFSPDGRRIWIALGESGTRIAILDSSDLAHPRLVGYFDPGFAVHDLSFSPDGRQVWITSAARPEVTVVAARSRHVLFHVRVGAPPQHLAFDEPYAYLTSGYGGTIESVEAASGRMVGRARAPYGSFELAAADGYVTTASLLRGTLAIYTPDLNLVRVVKLAPATREVAISRP